MIYEFRLPDVGEGVAEGEVVRWLVKEGDLLQEDQPMVEVMTDKATVEITTPRAGRVARRCYAEGQICPVGKVLIEIELEASATAPDAAAKPGASSAAPASPGPARAADKNPAVAPGAAPPRTNGAPSGPVLATPATRKLARDMGIDIREIAGTGPGGRITSDDVRARGAGAPASGRAAAASDEHERIPLRGLRKRIAENMVRAKHTAAHFTYVEEIDCTDLVRLRTRTNDRLRNPGRGSEPPAMGSVERSSTSPDANRLAGQGTKISFLPFIARATAQALRRFPELNASLDDAAAEIVRHRRIHLGLATATESGLIVPVVRDADRLSVLDMGREIDRLAGLTRTGKATREDLSGSTFTITSLGALGGLMATPIINHPEVAILGVHKIARRPAVVADRIEIRDLMNLSISVDHRVVDGYDAARFIADIKGALEAPAGLAPELA